MAIVLDTIRSLCQANQKELFDAIGGDRTLRKALALACNGEGTRGNFLGLFDGTLLLSTFIPLEGLTAETLGGRILAFADTAHAVRDALAAAATEQTASGGVSGEAFFLQA